MPRLVNRPRLAAQTETFQASSQREATEQLKRDLMRLDPRARSRYVTRFLSEFRQGEASTSLAEIMNQAVKTDVIYLADYHALPATQAFAVRFLNLLVEQTRKQREIILCLENFYERDQRWLEAFINGEISEERFLKLTRYTTEWGYAWAGYRSILKAAEQHEIKVFGIDCPLRHRARFIKRRDQNAASRIVALLKKYPGAQIVIFFGESHLADEHLPGKTRQIASKISSPTLKLKDLVIAQNIDELYWQFQNGTQMPGAVRVAVNKYCVFTATPLEKYQSYARVIEQWQHHDETINKKQASFEEETDYVSSCTRLLTTLLTALQLNSPRSWFRRARTLAETEPEIYSGCAFNTFAALLKRHGANVDETRAIRERAQEIGCAYSSRINALFVSSFDAVSVSEELTRYVIAALRGQLWSESGHITNARSELNGSSPCTCDQLAATMLDEAMIFFASKLIAPQRTAPLPVKALGTNRKVWLSSFSASEVNSFDEDEIHLLVRLFEKQQLSSFNCAEVNSYTNNKVLRDSVTRYFGRLLGERIYQAHHHNQLSLTSIHHLMTTDLTQPGHATKLWRVWQKRVK